MFDLTALDLVLVPVVAITRAPTGNPAPAPFPELPLLW
jgi:hypothetical protein